MSSPRDKSGDGPTRRGLMAGLAASLIAPAALGACQPLYGTATSGESMKDLMAQVDVGTIPGRVGQQVRNELIFATTRGGYPQPPKFSLDMVLRESVSDLLVERTGDVGGQVYNLSVDFTLRHIETGEVVVEGKSHARAPFDRFEPIFSNIRARIDAENRAAREVAESIRTRLAAYLSRSA